MINYTMVIGKDIYEHIGPVDEYGYPMPSCMDDCNEHKWIGTTTDCTDEDHE